MPKRSVAYFGALNDALFVICSSHKSNLEALRAYYPRPLNGASVVCCASSQLLLLRTIDLFGMMVSAPKYAIECLVSRWGGNYDPPHRISNQ